MIPDGERRKKLLRFGVTGLAGAATFFAILLPLVEWLKINPALATTAAFAVAVVQNYLFHYLWTFKSDKAHSRAAPRFLVASVLGLLVNGGVVWAGTTYLGLHYLVTQFVAIGVVITLNYLLAELWVF